MTAFESLLGPTLVLGEGGTWLRKSKGGETRTAAALKGKEGVGIYFAADWCEPSRRFTDKLITDYEDSLHERGLEIVLVSLDRTEEAYASTIKVSPYLALPYGRSDLRSSLGSQFGLQGLPLFVILDENARVITTDGCSKVAQDPKGLKFPWRAKQALDAIVCNSDFFRGDCVEDGSVIDGKTLGIYFAAQASRRSLQFTSILAQCYRVCKERRLPFEIVFVSHDPDEEAFDIHFKEMESAGGDWLAIPWDESHRREAMQSMFSVTELPRLVILNSSGGVINDDARFQISRDPQARGFPWAVSPIGDLTSPEGLGNGPALLVFAEPLTDVEQRRTRFDIEGVLLARPRTRPYLALNSNGATPKFRELCGLGPAQHIDRTRFSERKKKQPVAEMVLLDLLDNGAFYRQRASDAVTENGMLTFLASFDAGELQRKQLQPEGAQVIGRTAAAVSSRIPA